jgi:hypothetical protein
MLPDHQDGFLVYLRLDRTHGQSPEAFERPLTHCSSYEEARRVQREYRLADQECVIRYQGEVGGGD